MITVTGLKKSYGPVEALRGVSFQVEQGEIVGLLGPNGAGKTTLIKILTGFLQPDEGSATIAGVDVLQDPLAVQRQIGYLPENAPVYPELSVQSYLRLIAQLRDLPAEEIPRRISDAVRATQLEPELARPVGQLSKGYRQRVGLAQAIIHRPRLLILDEPTVGLDPTQIQLIRGLLKRLSEHSTILFSSHILPEVEALCDRAIIIIDGRLRADARLGELAVSPDAVIIFSRAPDETTIAALREVRGVVSVTTESGGAHPMVRVKGATGTDLCPDLFAAASANHWPVRELRSDPRTLETVFNDLARPGATV